MLRAVETVKDSYMQGEASIPQSWCWREARLKKIWLHLHKKFKHAKNHTKRTLFRDYMQVVKLWKEKQESPEKWDKDSIGRAHGLLAQGWDEVVGYCNAPFLVLGLASLRGRKKDHWIWRWIHGFYFHLWQLTVIKPLSQSYKLPKPQFSYL